MKVSSIPIGGIPIVSLDNVYLSPDEKDIISLDCTRLDKNSALVSRKNPSDLRSVDKQIESIALSLKENNQREIVLADDVVFSGKVLKTVIEKFKKEGIETIGIRSAVSTSKACEYFNKTLPLGLKCGCLLGDDVIDQICERDFYFGIAQSGISINQNGKILKAPYFKPFGNPVERASIPKEFEEYFSLSCIVRSLALWQRIERLSGKKVLISDLPEVIVNTNEKDEVTKVLKKGIDFYEKNTNRSNGFCSGPKL